MALLEKLRIYKKARPRFADEVLQNVVLATVQTVFSRSNSGSFIQSSEGIHRELMTLFVATVGQGYLTQKELCRASDIFWQWVPKLLHGSII